ncbi:DoxX family protein [Stackebrandtia soli]|uniref:DoxX family protein n=1 Tax=Stackebrandtia soli TaxID=1892856 RepID=UPI0039EBD04F
MNVALWIVQVVLAVVFLGAGTLKTVRPKDQLRDQMAWVEDFSQGTIRFIGVTQILGAIGLVLPGLTGIATVLTPLAALGLAVTMVLAAIVHIRRSEWREIIVNVVLLVAAAFVVWGRFGPYAF